VKDECKGRTFYFYPMTTDELKPYIEEKLAALKKEKDMNEVVNEGKLSFGLHSKDYKHLPSWNDLVRNKKKLVRVFWINCLLISFLIVGFTYSFGNNLDQNWVKSIIVVVGYSLGVTLLYVLGFYFSQFYHVRKTEREVRKLIYEDILDKINKASTHSP
jgi:hypothetical protein